MVSMGGPFEHDVIGLRVGPPIGLCDMWTHGSGRRRLV